MRKYQNIPQPFVLLVDAPQDDRQSTAELRFGVRLFGPAIRYWPYVVHAFKTAEDSGLGRARVAYRVERVTGPPDGLALWVRDRNDWIQPTPQVANLCEPSLPEQCRIRWRFETPLLLSKDGVRAPQDLSGLDLVLAGRRRFKIISAFYGSDLPTECTQCQYLDASAFSTSESNLRFWSFTRYSGRQQRRMRLGGLLGEVVIEGPWAEAGSWLSIASILHLGKATSFGFGRVSWEVV